MEKDKMIRPCPLLLIGGSAGSIEVLLKVLPRLEKETRLITILVLHRKNSGASSLSGLLSSYTSLPVKEIEDKECIQPGHIYVAPADYHLLFENRQQLSLDLSEKVNYSRPSIDVTFESASEVYREGLCCLLLSGANADGGESLRLVKKNGGQIAVQDPESAGSPYMPQQALLKNQVDFILNIQQIGDFLHTLSGNGTTQR
jgi:two-component system chemotaxis response regulator CheB